MKADVYQRVTDQIVAQLDKGVRPRFQPWNAEHAAGRITRPLRGNGVPYRGINVVMLWGASIEKEYSAPIWMTFKQAHELGGNVRKGEPAERAAHQAQRKAAYERMREAARGTAIPNVARAAGTSLDTGQERDALAQPGELVLEFGGEIIHAAEYSGT